MMGAELPLSSPDEIPTTSAATNPPTPQLEHDTISNSMLMAFAAVAIVLWYVPSIRLLAFAPSKAEHEFEGFRFSRPAREFRRKANVVERVVCRR